MNITQRTKEISRAFSLEETRQVSGCAIKITPFEFKPVVGIEEIRKVQKQLKPTDFSPLTDDHIDENKTFRYAIFSPAMHNGENNEAILLLHGLNERSWEKYFPWAEALVKETGKPVILFPLAFHMNRTPSGWHNPRELMSWINARKQSDDIAHNTTFANLVLSRRLRMQPLRFYSSGLESIYNIIQLCSEIKKGEHPLFSQNTSINIFAYSIGAFISQVVLLANPRNLFDNTRLFMFCGGSIFSEINGSARDILDEEANARIQEYYNNDFLQSEHMAASEYKILEETFKMMLRRDIMQESRESRFQHIRQHIRAISLKKDTVIPTQGIIHALGEPLRDIVEEVDFPYPYSHQVPFPSNPKHETLVEQAFAGVFGKACAFL